MNPNPVLPSTPCFAKRVDGSQAGIRIGKISTFFRCWLLAWFVFLPHLRISADAVTRPLIWAKPSERTAILEKIGQNDWAGKLVNELQSHADAAVPKSLEERREKLLALPLVWSDHESAPTFRRFQRGEGNKNDEDTRWGYPKAPQYAMMNGLKNAIDCGVLFYLSGDESYAVAAADILSTFVNAIVQIPVSTEKSFNNGWVYESNHLLEARVLSAQLPIIYDFVYNYLKDGGKVYDLASGELRSFDFDSAQKVFRTYAELALNTGLYDSNWPVLETTSLLHNILALDDLEERERLIPYFVDTDTKNQASLEKIYEMFEKPGDVWHEERNLLPCKA